MKLFEEFKQYENLWENTNYKASAGRVANPVNQEARFKSLLDQINNDTPGNHYLRSLNDRIFYITVECSFGQVNVRTWFNSRNKGYTLQLDGEAANKGDYYSLTWEEVLDYLIDEGIIEDTNLII
jgi:hypothetical protein